MTVRVEYPVLTDRTGNVLVGDITNMTSMADRGQVGQGSLAIDDTSGALTLDPLKAMRVYEPQCNPSTIFYGYSTDRQIGRPPEDQLATARRWTVGLLDGNAQLQNRYLPFAASARRPAETDVQRVAWLLTLTSFVRVSDTGFVANTGGVAMSAADYGGQTALQVLQDCGSISGRNYFAFWDDTANKLALFYHANTDAVFTSTLQISNVRADEDRITTFAPSMDAVLTKDPANMYTEVDEHYKGGIVRVFSGSSQTTDIIRGIYAPDLNTTDLAVATVRANQYLAQYATEVDRITCTLELPVDKVNKILAGHRIQVKFSHLAGYTSYTYLRVVQRTVLQDAAKPGIYVVQLILCNPITAAGSLSGGPNNVVNPPVGPFRPPPGGTITLVQSGQHEDIVGTTPSTFSVSLPAPATAGNFIILQVGARSSPGNFALGLIDGSALGYANDYNNDSDAGFAYSYSTLSKIATGGEQTFTGRWTAVGSAGTVYSVISEWTGATGYEANSGASIRTITASGALPAVTPSGAGAALMMGSVFGHGVPTTPTGQTLLQDVLDAGADDHRTSYQIVASPTGSYDGTWTEAIAQTEVSSNAVYSNSAGVAQPGPGQPVGTDPSTTSPGSGTTSGTTVYPYAPNSLFVFVDGIYQHATETNPTTGAYTLSFVPRKNEVIDVRYQGY